MDFTITAHVAILSTTPSGWVKELNLVSWNGNNSKYDIRSWNPEHNKMTKGVCLTEEEAARLSESLGAPYKLPANLPNLIACTLYTTTANNTTNGNWCVEFDEIADAFGIPEEQIPYEGIADALKEMAGVSEVTLEPGYFSVTLYDHYCGLDGEE